MADKARDTSNSLPEHREPPPSLGMVAHIWAGHQGPVDHREEAGEPAEIALDSAAVELTAPQAARVKVV